MKSDPKPKAPSIPRGRRTGKPVTEHDSHEGAADEFEREGMGIAPKE